jgi:transglutaminase-like putative cysteine protease
VYEWNRARFNVTPAPLPPGDAGIFKTLALMRRLSDEGSRMLEVRETAIDVVRSAGVDPHDLLGATAALFRFVRDRIYFVLDPVGVQFLQSPRYTLSRRAGNCAQKASLLAAMLKSLGIPASFRAIGASKRYPGSFSHVYVSARVGNDSIPLDPTYGNNSLGWQFPNPSRYAEVPA